jgi:hypothetical protein
MMKQQQGGLDKDIGKDLGDTDAFKDLGSD